MNKTQTLYQKAKKIIPGGTQLLSKRPEMFAPEQWPAYFSKAEGCEVWDLDNKHYYDVAIHGIGACLLGYNDPDVSRAVQKCVSSGSFSILNPPEEVELAEVLCNIHPWAEQVRFARTGGEIMSIAVRIARATTKRSVVAICGYHGWHDWYLAANLGEDDSLQGLLLPGLEPLGVPEELRGTTQAFRQNDTKTFEEIINKYGDQLAAVVMEPCRNNDPDLDFLQFVRDKTHKAGALLIFDEITIGWRLTLGGAHLRFGVNPDMAVFAKSIGNGHPMAAVIGTKESMSGAHGSFISSTYWTESVGPVAALATIKKMQEIDVPGHCSKMGKKMQSAWRRLGNKHALPIKVEDSYPALAHFAFDHKQAIELKTLYIQQMLKRGFLASTAIYLTLAHTDEIIDKYIVAIDEVFTEIACALKENAIAESLDGPVAHVGFKRLIK